MTADEYTFLIALRSLMLMAVDKIDRRCGLGKYKNAQPVTVTAADSIAGAVGGAATESEHAELPPLR